MLQKNLMIKAGVEPVIALLAFQHFGNGDTVGSKDDHGTFEATSENLVRQTVHVYQTKTQYIIEAVKTEI